MLGGGAAIHWMLGAAESMLGKPVPIWAWIVVLAGALAVGHAIALAVDGGCRRLYWWLLR